MSRRTERRSLLGTLVLWLALASCASVAPSEELRAELGPLVAAAQRAATDAEDLRAIRAQVQREAEDQAPRANETARALEAAVETWREHSDRERELRSQLARWEIREPERLPSADLVAVRDVSAEHLFYLGDQMRHAQRLSLAAKYFYECYRRQDPRHDVSARGLLFTGDAYARLGDDCHLAWVVRSLEPMAATLRRTPEVRREFDRVVAELPGEWLAEHDRLTVAVRTASSDLERARSRLRDAEDADRIVRQRRTLHVERAYALDRGLERVLRTRDEHWTQLLDVRERAERAWSEADDEEAERLRTLIVEIDATLVELARS